MKKSYLSMMVGILLFTIFAFYESTFVVSFDFNQREWMLSLRTESLKIIVLAFTHVGDAKVLAGLCLMGAIVHFIMKRWKNGLLLIGSILVSYGLNLLVKSLFERERPLTDRLLEEDGYSFPSGNAMVGTSFYLFAAFLLYERYPKRWILVAGAILPFLLGVNRVYIGVHYPSDILAGFTLGIVLFILLSKLTAKHAKQVESVNRNNTNTAV
ncbi:phosphatase PAP2 family protein [Fictibacillus norfolkensis]|uniref:Phosphatase PAP2 family protein n=1 Tax=Fictibacillus norfolkensis TaxID=2762233 RepID=A0ABR8SRE2_9BACL|nr:phosphatase PAP2 family protein [Fictibacillus norfolkensis]MBD7965923.1 phosphatase PAP2 family protein [Fictibacillus norfolkensis]